jgi:mannitol/fructose-specific phosphotransferase system IIA component (Ntr-type)
MVEVVADLEHTVQELKKPLDIEGISRRIQEADGTVHSIASLQGYLKKGLLVADLKGSSKEAIIDELIEVLSRSGHVMDVADARKAVLGREASMSTGMQFGVAIPHGRTDSVDKLVCAIGIKTDGVEFDAIDGKPSRIFVLALSPLSSAAPHMQFMSMVSQVLNEQGRTALLSCDNEDEMYAVLSGAGMPSARPSMMGMVGLRKDRRPTLADFLRPNLLVPDLKASSKAEVIDELLEALVANKYLTDLDAARESILAREAQMSTGMEHGVAIPHARTDIVSDLVCVVGVKRDGLDFGALDGEPSQIFVLTLTPKSADAPHVQFMAMVSRALDEQGRRLALAATTGKDLWDALTRT